MSIACAIGPRAGSGGSSSARRGASRPSSPCAGSRPGRSGRRSAARRFATAAGVDAASWPRRVPVGRPLPDVPDHVVEPVTVRREPARPARCPRTRRAGCSRTGTRPARCSPSAGPPACTRRPRRTRRRRGRRARRTPTRPRSAAPCPPRRRTPRRRRRRRARRGDARGRGASCPGPSGCRQSAPRRPRPPLVRVSQVDRARRTSRTRPSRRRAARASRPGTGPGRAAARPTVTWPVAFTKRVNSRFVTGCASIQKPPTVTSRTGASSG